ncbi:hypothetical protein FRC00_001618 [Tulasnella sp. 408]|nr:hypothetical protein FRC00_001618 [Tulasnella sp. 408]
MGDTTSVDSQQTSRDGFPNGQETNLAVDLPYDILLIIFSQCWKEHKDKEEEGPAERLGGPGGPHFPTIASHVCRKWRQHALDTAMFWAILEFRQRNPPEEKYETWLKRSKDCPLDIVIGPQPFKASSIKHAKEILRLTEPHIKRWKSISTYALPDKVLRTIFDRITQGGLGRLEKLETVKVVQKTQAAEDPYTPDHKRWRFKPFSHADEAPPALRNLILEGASPQYFSGRFELFQVWGIINRFLRDPDQGVRNVHHFLSALPDLRVLHVHDRRSLKHPMETIYSQLIPVTSAPLFTHPSLTELSIVARQATRNTVISSLVLPSLVYSLDRRQGEQPIGICCLSHLARNQPFSQLVSLRLGGSPSPHLPHPNPSIHQNLNVFNMEHLEGALAGLPELKILTFDHVDFGGPQAGGRESYLACVGWLCPRLRSLVLVLCEGYTLETLLSVIEQREKSEGLESLVRIALVDWRIPGTREELERIKIEFELFSMTEYSPPQHDRIMQREWIRSMEA